MTTFCEAFLLRQPLHQTGKKFCKYSIEAPGSRLADDVFNSFQDGLGMLMLVGGHLVLVIGLIMLSMAIQEAPEG